MGPGLATNVSPPYYAWSMHDSFKPQMDSICFHYDNQFCHFSMQPHIGTSSFELLPLPLHDKSYMEELCRKDVKKDTIEIMLMRLKFYNPKTLKSLWLFGRNFKALIKIVPTTYDPSNIILKVELFKLYREVRPIYERPDSINPIESNRTIFDDQIIDGVYTFTVLPHGQLMVFFASQFCYISPYDFECNLRDMSTLLGCTTPANEILEKRVYIVPHISDSNRNSASAHSMVNNESTHITNWTQSKSTSPPSMGIGHPVQSVQSNEPSTSTVSSNSSSSITTTNTVHQFTHNSEKSNPVSIVFSVTDSSNTSNGATSSSGTIADINSQNSSSNSSSSSSYAGRSIINSIPFTLSTTTTTTTSTPTSTSAPKSDNDSILYHRRASFNEEHITQSEIEWLNSQTSLHYLFIGFKLFGKLFLRGKIQ
ncbi:hypothetical protein RDWZM_003340 [Blomia tropicalis]|uniref:Uncharacterized protein n=1 Tax=Blomia tropicalis TaxID=40697 RepID=A0A9Q0MJD1_BLOTA|nr:hypothetical protein RDWZM_003340 [Blomia tropicalis]